MQARQARRLSFGLSSALCALLAVSALPRAAIAETSSGAVIASKNVTIQRHDAPSDPGHYLLYTLVGALAGGIGVAAWSANQRRQAGLRTQALQNERTQLRALIAAIPDLVWLKDAQGIYQTCNPEFEKFFGAQEADIVGKRDHDFVSRQQADTFRQSDQAAMALDQPFVSESLITYASNGQQVLVQTVKTPMRNSLGQVTGVLGISRNITNLRQTENALKKINRASRLLGESSTVLIHTEREADLLQRICELAVVDGGYLMAWVGLAEHDAAKTVRPIARAGVGMDYLDHAQFSWADDDSGRGPCGVAVRSRAPVCNQNFLTNPKMAPWRELALKHGFQSSAGLPFVVDDNTIGVLSLYATEPDAFQKEEVDLLMKLANALGFGLGVIRAREARDQALASLKESEYLFRSQFDLGNFGINITMPDKRWVRYNRCYCDMLGYTEHEMQSMKWEQLVHPDDLPAALEQYRRLISGEIDRYQMDQRAIR
ncbi:MAG: PAS domain S-box protein, partial [Pseudomonadota bacterium]